MFGLIFTLFILLTLILWSVKLYHKRARSNQISFVLCQEYEMLLEYTLIAMLVFMIVMTILWSLAGQPPIEIAF